MFAASSSERCWLTSLDHVRSFVLSSGVMMFNPPFLSGSASISRIGDEGGFCPVILGINFSRIIVSLFSKTSVRLGVVRDRNVNLWCIPFVKAWYTFWGDFFTWVASLFSSVENSVAFSTLSFSQAAEEPITEPSTRCPSTSSTSIFPNKVIATSLWSVLVTRWHFEMWYPKAG